MSEDSKEGVRAGIGKPNLLEVVRKAAVQFQADMEAAALKQEEDIQKVMAKRRKGLLWWRRNFTHAEARWSLINTYWTWEARRDEQKAAEKLRRLDDLAILAQSKTLDSLVLSEKDLMMLKDFL
jgi:hypothetical protein